MEQVDQEKKYKGRCYVGVVGSEEENGQCRDSIDSIKLQKGDEIHFIRATKGFEARQSHLNKFMEDKRFDFLLLLDHDMIFPPNTLERLRSHGLPYMSGLYMRRRFDPMSSIWFEKGEPGVLPMKIFNAILNPGALYEIGASGWGCILVHRDVVEAVRRLLKGEQEIIEDDMDVYPYDLDWVMAAINNIENAPAASKNILLQEIRPLRGLKDNIGSDIRFPFYARLAGFQLIGDSAVQCMHMTNYPISFKDFFAGDSIQQFAQLQNAIEEEYQEESKRVQDRLKELSDG